MSRCLQCDQALEVSQLRCRGCEVTHSGRFMTGRLARLSGSQQRLIEQVILAGGNLKEVARDAEVSYPTFRKRLEAVIDDLNELRRRDDETARALLEDVEHKRLAPEAAARQIKEMNGGT
ncbi:MAG: DUF2089 family protein [Rhizobiales bacterium]|nr:DUF2089 family protein [Hyphomicrobiales bacterium]